MAEILDNKELVSFKELLMANMIQTDTLSQLLIEKGMITEEEFFLKLKKIQAEYESKKGISIDQRQVLFLPLFRTKNGNTLQAGNRRSFIGLIVNG